MKSCAFQWQKMFSEGREDVEDEERPGRPVTIKPDKNVEKMRTLVTTDCRLGIKTIAEVLNMDK